MTRFSTAMLFVSASLATACGRKSSESAPMRRTERDPVVTTEVVLEQVFPNGGPANVIEKQIQHFVPAGSRIRMSTVEGFASVVRGINEFARLRLSLPSEIKVEIEDEAGNAEFNSEGFIRLPQSFVLSYFPFGPRPAKFSNNILAHEYGHWIFSSNLEIKPPLGLWPEMDAIEAKMRPLGDELAHIRNVEMEKPNLGNEEFERLFARAEELERLLAPLYAERDALAASDGVKLEKYNAFLRPLSADVLGPYTELFGDVTAVVFTGNGAVVAETHCEAPDNIWPRCKLRDFTDYRPVDSYDWESEDLKDVHRQLVAVRAHLWKHDLQGLASGIAKADALRKVAKVLADEIGEIQGTMSDADFARVSVKERNVRLIKRLDSEFGRR